MARLLTSQLLQLSTYWSRGISASSPACGTATAEIGQPAPESVPRAGVRTTQPLWAAHLLWLSTYAVPRGADPCPVWRDCPYQRAVGAWRTGRRYAVLAPSIPAWAPSVETGETRRMCGPLSSARQMITIVSRRTPGNTLFSSFHPAIRNRPAPRLLTQHRRGVAFMRAVVPSPLSAGDTAMTQHPGGSLHKYARRRWETRYVEAVSERIYPTHLLLSCKACADRSRYFAASEHGGGRLEALGTGRMSQATSTGEAWSGQRRGSP